MSLIATVDLDDTLIETNVHYSTAKTRGHAYISEITGTPVTKVRELFSEIDRAAVGETFNKERFPKSFVYTAEELLDRELSETEQTYLESFGWSVYLSEEDYRESGTKEGATEMLDRLHSHVDSLHLISAGDEGIQNRKIRGIGVEEYFDEIHITDFEKNDVIEYIVEQEQTHPDNVYHIGNSATSDVKSAIEANVNAVYIPDNEWINTYDVDLTKDCVHQFDTLYEFHKNIPNTLQKI